jgi:hypothetical protein
MQKTTRSALMAAMLSLATLMTQSSHAQDQEEGALELEGPSPAAEASPAPAPAPAPTSTYDDEPTRNDTVGSGRSATPGDLRIYAGPRAGFGGGFRSSDGKVIYAARVTPGVAVGADYVLHRFFAVGLETRLDWASLNENVGYMFWSLLAKPRVRHQLKAQPIEIYAAVPMGLSLSNASLSNETGKASGAVGISAGANYFFTSHWALNFELGWTWHWHRFDRQVPGNGPPQGVNGIPAPITLHFKDTFGQVAFGLNVIYALL